MASSMNELYGHISNSRLSRWAEVNTNVAGETWVCTGTGLIMCRQSGSSGYFELKLT